MNAKAYIYMGWSCNSSEHVGVPRENFMELS